MRKLQTRDVFAAMRLVKEAGIHKEFKELASRFSEKQITVSEMGAELIMVVLEACGNERVEKLFSEFFAGPLEVTSQEVSEMEIPDLVENFASLGKLMDPEGWQAFFTSLLRILR